MKIDQYTEEYLCLFLSSQGCYEESDKQGTTRIRLHIQRYMFNNSIFLPLLPV